VRKIGSGGMASVYLARQLDLDRLVALKELRLPRDPDRSVARRFLREARLAGSLNHPNIVTVHDYFGVAEVPYIAMEYLERGSLRRYMSGLTLAQIGGVMQGVLAGLAHAERQRIVHRDIKPENLLVTVEGGVKIADFGIAKATNALEEGTLVTRAGLTVGTPNYIAPEQAMAGELGPWTDLYSVGITAFELLTGRTPFGDTQDPMAIALRQINEPVPRVSDVAPGVPAWMSDWVAWLVAKVPAQRPQTAERAWDALEETLFAILGPRWARDAGLYRPDERPTSPLADPRLAPTVPPRTSRPPTGPTVARPRPRRFPTSLKATAAVATLLATAALAFAGRPGGGQGGEIAPSTPGQAATPAPVDVTAARVETSLASRVAPAQRLARSYQEAAAELAKRPDAGSGTLPAALAALRDAARSYGDAAAAAARNDAAGYGAAMTTAAEAVRTSSSLISAAQGTPAATTRARQTPPVQTRATPTSPQTTQSQSGGSACSGDSSSDDPSDDACSGEP
jgi:tRNA A-37 threonylcarbamoyl transferase component Bud32